MCVWTYKAKAECSNLLVGRHKTKGERGGGGSIALIVGFPFILLL